MIPRTAEREQFNSLPEIANSFRTTLASKQTVLVYAHNGIGKTRLSMAFKDVGKTGGQRDTLYYNAFTEDLFTWDNDLDADSSRKLQLNATSHFFDGLAGMDMENRVRTQLGPYANFDFKIDTTEWTVSFSRIVNGHRVDDIKVSRSEENLFIWCFFLAVLQLVIDGVAEYDWVKFVYIDDPISSLDENNAIHLASSLAQTLKRQVDEQNRTPRVRAVISSHHTLFFSVMGNELSNSKKYSMDRIPEGGYALTPTGNTPFFQHVSALVELQKAADSGNLYTYHFNILRGILEKIASFHGLSDFKACIKRDDDDLDGIVHARIVSVLNHGGYSLFEPVEMGEENKRHFAKVLRDTLARFPFSAELFTATAATPTI